MRKNKLPNPFTVHPAYYYEILSFTKAACGDVKHLAEHKLKDIEERIKNLMNMKNVLTKLINQCFCGEVSTEKCPILEVIDNK